VRIVVDRIEGDIAVVELEGERTIQLPVEMLPGDTREGSVLTVQLGSGARTTEVVFRIDEEGEAALRAEVEALRESIPQGPEGDLSL